MSRLTKTAYKSKYTSIFADNTSRDITEEDLRDFKEDTADSFLSIDDNFIDEDSMASDSATKAPSQQSVVAYVQTYVAANITGINFLANCACATTANITLSGEQTIDGVLTSASRVLVKDQSTASQNGVYVSGAGAWTRATDSDTSAELNNAIVTVTGGTVNGSTNWRQQTANPTIGSSSISWTAFGTSGLQAMINANYIPLASGGNSIINSVMYQDSSRIVIGGTTAARKLTVIQDDNNAMSYPIRATHTRTSSSGFATGQGVGMEFEVETSDGNNEVVGIMEMVSTSLTGGSENFDWVVKLMRSGASADEKLRLTSEGSLQVMSTNVPTIQGIRISSDAATKLTGLLSQHRTTSDMTDGFAALVTFLIRDNAGVDNTIASIGAERAGADNTGNIIFQPATAGTRATKMTLAADGTLTLASAQIKSVADPTAAQDVVTMNYSQNSTLSELVNFYFTDFEGGIANTDFGSSAFNNGGGAGVTPTFSTFGINSTENAFGVVEMSTGTSTAGGSAIVKSLLGTFGFGFTHTLEFRLALSALSDGTNTYFAYAGYNGVTGSDAVDGAYFRYSHGSNGGRWSAITASNGSITAEDTGVSAVAGEFYVFKIVVNSTATQVDFYINGVKTNDITTNIINDSARRTNLNFAITKTAGSTARLMYMDYLKHSTLRTTSR